MAKKIRNADLKIQTIMTQKGQALIEYLIIVALLGVGSIVMMRSVGSQLNVKFASVIKSIGGSVEGGALDSVQVKKNQVKRKDLSNFARGTTESRGGSEDEDSEK